MVRSKRIRKAPPGLASGSPQSKPSGKTGVSEPVKGRRKKSKSSKSEPEDKRDPVADRAALEEESARALMLLSTSALQNGNRAPYFNLDDTEEPSGKTESSSVQAQVQQQRHADGLEENSAKKRKTKEKGKNRKETKHKRNSQLENRPRSPSPEELFIDRATHHPLDEEPSDDELVQEYERGNSRGKSRLRADPIAQDAESHEKKIGVAKSKDGAQRSRGAPKKAPSKKRKRQSTEPAAGQTESHGLPIDPSLHAIGALPSASYTDPLDTLNANALPELQQRKSKTRKKNQPPDNVNGDNDSNMFLNADDDRDGDRDITIPRAEDEGPLYSALNPPGAPDPNSETFQTNPEPENAGDKKAKGHPGGKGGFSPAEIAMLDNYRDRYCRANNLVVPGFNHLIQLNVKSNEFVTRIFNDVQELFPDRTRAAVQRFCRRRFHNFHARGVWTPEEDADLKAAVAEKGTSWKVIGEMLGRFNEDCRDRYRNYLAPSAAHRNRDAWTEKEVINLSNSIIDCMQLMKKERQRTKEEKAGHDVPLSDSDSDQEAEDLKLVNWQTVSDMMEKRGTPRSRIQCSFKWGKIKETDRDRFLKEVKQAQQNLRELEKGNFTANNMKRSTGWRLKAASKHVSNMRPGDKYDLLTAILNSAAPEEDNIPWRMIGDEAFRARWGFSHRKAGWFALKKEVEGSEDMDYRQVIQQLLRGLLEEGIDERWNPPADAPVDGASASVARQRQMEQQKDPSSDHGFPQQDQNSHHPQPASEAEKNTSTLTYANNEAAEHVRAAPVVPNMRGGGGGGYESREASPDSLFDGDGEQPDLHARVFEPQHEVVGEVSPELADRIQLLQSV